MTILIIDSGFRTKHACFSQTKIIDTYDFINNIKDVDNQPGDVANQFHHGTMVLSILGGRVNGTFSGVVPKASFYLAKTEDLRSESPIEEDNFARAVEWGESKGVQVISSSLGYSDWYKHSEFNGLTAVST